MKYEIDQISSKEFAPGFHGKMIHTSSMTLAYWNIEKGATLPEHHHHHEQVINLLEGRFAMNIGGKEYEFGAGDVFVINSNIPHSGKALTSCKILDVFSPAREDYM